MVSKSFIIAQRVSKKLDNPIPAPAGLLAILPLLLN